MLGEFLGDLGVACYVEDEEIFGCLFANDTTEDPVSIFQLLSILNSIVPSDDFIIQLSKALLDLCNVHVLPPCLLSFPGWLAELFGGFARASRS